MRRLFAGLDPGVPVIHFGTDTGALLELQRDAGGDVIGLDWRVDLAHGVGPARPGVAVQGNLDPTVLFAPRRGSRTPGPAGSSTEAAGRPGTSSTSATASCPTRRSNVLALVDEVHAYRQS